MESFLFDGHLVPDRDVLFGLVIEARPLPWLYDSCCLTPCSLFCDCLLVSDEKEHGTILSSRE